MTFGSQKMAASSLLAHLPSLMRQFLASDLENDLVEPFLQLISDVAGALHRLIACGSRLIGWVSDAGNSLRCIQGNGCYCAKHYRLIRPVQSIVGRNACI